MKVLFLASALSKHRHASTCSGGLIRIAHHLRAQASRRYLDGALAMENTPAPRSTP